MKILVFGIHPDDVEIACGGTVVLAARAGHDVTIADLSEGRSSSNGTPEERAGESAAAARIMGVKKRLNLGLPDTQIRTESDDQMGAVVSCIRDERPELVLIPFADDPHPDHWAGGELIERALYLSGVHGYHRDGRAWRVPHTMIYPGRRDFEPQIVVDVTPTHEFKIKAILAHKSQFVPDEGRVPTPLNSPDFIGLIEARARIHGRRIGVRFGEGFLSSQPIALADFRLFEV